MRLSFRILVVAAALASAILSTTAAFAAPVPWQKMDIALHSEQNGSVLLISGDLPATAKLPAQATFSVPAGSEIQWLGEILGGPIAEDPELEYTKSTKKGSDVYQFTLKKARTAQIEIPTTGAAFFDGTAYKPSLKWTASQDTPEISVRVRIPREVEIAAPVTGAVLQAGDTGYSFYSKTFKNVKAGDELDLTFAYTLTAAPASTGTKPAGTSSDTMTLIIIGVVMAAAFGLLVLKVQGKQASSAVAADEDDTEKPARKSAPQTPADVEEPPTKKIKPAFVVVAVIGALVIGTVAAANSGTSARVVDGKIKKSFGAASP